MCEALYPAFFQWKEWMTGASNRSNGSGKTALVVDDSVVAREKIASILQELGCTVLTASDGLEGVKLAKERGSEIDLVVLDIQMPRMDGNTALKYMRLIPEMASLPIIMLTTQVGTDVVRTSLSHGATDFIRKDASIPKITERLKGYLQAKKKKEAVDQPLDSRLAESIIKGCRKYHPLEKGPYILFFESLNDLQALGEAKDKNLLSFYQRVAQVMAGIEERYPGLGSGYSIEHETKEVTRLVKQDTESVKLVMISGRQNEGLSLARMLCFVQQDGPPVLLLCDSITALPLDQRDQVVKAGVELVERKRMDVGELETLIERHMVPEAQTTSSGLKYLELTAGAGNPPQAGQQVTVHYTAMLQNGTIFDNTNERGEPFQFVLGQEIVIDGWEEGISMMKQGGRAMLVIPPDLGYGEEGDGGAVPPNATLVFHVELVAVDKPSEEDPLV